MGQMSPKLFFSQPTAPEHTAALAATDAAFTAAGITTFNGFPFAVISIAGIITQCQDQTAAYYVWPDEGSVVNGKWVFTKPVDLNDDDDWATKPLLVDATSANAFRIINEAVNDTNKAKLHKAILDSRGMCVWAFEKMIWPFVGFGKRG
ncbi:membrane protein [Rhodobacter phage RcDurkin]|nr:membrane protein [Rhodobacter phage RcDurkin]